MSAAVSSKLTSFGLFEYDHTAGLLYHGDEETLLPPKAAAVLHVLLENSGKLVSKDELLETVWEGSFVTESSLTDAVSMLRQVLGDDSRDPTYIQTLHRHGYRFIAPVEQQAVEDAGVEGVAVPSLEPAGEARVRCAGGWAPGDRLGNYEILDTLGAGAMGTVYRARDKSLEREVAIKALPVDFANDPERVARLEREAKLLASVSHPNIAAIHSLEEADGIKFPVFELVGGETLEHRLRPGRLPVDEALEVGRQIASALEAAHEQGVIHRDLKPANIKVTPEGQVKVLDFGLAKALEVKVFGDAPNTSPTESIAVKGSRRGSIVGTAAYMSPEQARGQEVDKRADIWSFGSVLYELLTGRRPFEGETVSDTIAGVLEREPDWDALPPETPALVRSLLRRVLQKDPANRLHDIADARIEIEEALSQPGVGLPGIAPEEARSRLWRRALPWGAGIAVGAIVTGLALWGSSFVTPTVQGPAHLVIPVEPGQHLWGTYPSERTSFGRQRPTRTAIAFAPDGSFLVYAATADESSGREEHAQRGQLYLRWINQLQAHPLPGTERGGSPFVSPDGEWIGFYTQRPGGGYAIKKAAVAGGQPRTILSEAPVPYGASWGDNGTILLADGESGGLLRVSDSGGSSPDQVTTIDRGRGETSHRLPWMLPGSRAVLFTVAKGWNWDRAEIAVQSLDSDRHEILLVDGADARYVPTGHLVFVRRGTLMAVPFDLGSLEVTGEPFPVQENLMQAAYTQGMGIDTGAGQFSISGSGLLAYVAGGIPPKQESSLVWVDREGAPEALAAQQRDYWFPRLSPDDQRVAFTDGPTGAMDVWVHDIRRETTRRLTFDGENMAPVWSPDGERIAFASNRDGAAENLYWMTADGSEQERLTSSDQRQVPASWSPDGVLAFSVGYPMRQMDIWVLPLDDVRNPRPFQATSFDERFPAFSPDGKWLAYTSNESGRREVYVKPYPGPGSQQLVSTGGGQSPLWSRDGREIFYRSPPRVLVVEVSAGQTFTAGRPKFLFEGSFSATGSARAFDVAREGRFMMISGSEMEPQPAKQINVILNWFVELKRLVPTER